MQYRFTQTILHSRQVFVLIDKLYENKTIEPASLTETIKTSDSYDEVDSEEVLDDSQQISTVGIDYDLIRINDPALSFMLRRRVKLIEVDFNIFDDWKEKHLKEYKGIPLLICDEKMRKYLLSHRTGETDGDLSLIHISEPTRQRCVSRMPSSA